LMLIKSDI